MQKKTPPFEVEEGGCRQRAPSILWFGGSCSSIAVLTNSLRGDSNAVGHQGSFVQSPIKLMLG